MRRSPKPPNDERCTLAMKPNVARAMEERAGMEVCVTAVALAAFAPLSVGTDATRLFGAIALATAGGTCSGTFAYSLCFSRS